MLYVDRLRADAGRQARGVNHQVTVSILS
jgi:hypothetical protein